MKKVIRQNNPFHYITKNFKQNYNNWSATDDNDRNATKSFKKRTIHNF